MYPEGTMTTTSSAANTACVRAPVLLLCWLQLGEEITVDIAEKTLLVHHRQRCR